MFCLFYNDSSHTVGTDKAELHGSFTTKDGQYLVTFHYAGDGLIFYSFRENKVGDRVSSPVAIPSAGKNKSKSEAKITAVVFAASVCIAFSGVAGALFLKTDFM